MRAMLNAGEETREQYLFVTRYTCILGKVLASANPVTKASPRVDAGLLRFVIIR